VAVASAAPHASLHLGSVFLQAGCSFCHPTNSVKALKAVIAIAEINFKNNLRQVTEAAEQPTEKYAIK